MRQGSLAVLASAAATVVGGSAGAQTNIGRASGPAGSVILLDQRESTPLVHIVLAARTGSAADPRGREGLTHLAVELARRGAGGRDREALDQALEALGANLEVRVDPDSTRLVGEVLARNLDPFLALLADIVLRPTFEEAELVRTRRELIAHLDELRNDDRALCGRFFDRRLYGDHPYGRAPEGTAASLALLSRAAVRARFRAAFVGRNLIFAAAGPVPDFEARVRRAFGGLKEGTARTPPSVSVPRPQKRWRIQIVDKPDRQQTQIMFGHAGLPATHRDFLALSVGLATFGGRAMKSTLMDEVRTQRGLAYGAYMSAAPMRGPGPVRGWVFSGAERTVSTLKLVLHLYRRFLEEGVTAERLRFFQSFLAGTHGSDMDAPERRIAARVSAEIVGLPPDHVDTWAGRVQALQPAEVNEAMARHLQATDLAIVLVATAEDMRQRLAESGVDPGAIDVVPFDGY